MIRIGWRAGSRRKRDGTPIYSNVAIEIFLILRVVSRLPLRQTQGFVRSLFILIVDSTGLQMHSGRAWMQQKHRIKKLRKTPLS